MSFKDFSSAQKNAPAEAKPADKSKDAPATQPEKTPVEATPTPKS